MRHITVFTGTRAEYGLLYWLMRDINADPDCRLSTLVTGTHLSPEFGLTWRDIEADGFPLSERVEMLLSSDSGVGIAKAMGLGIIGYSDALTRLAPDVLVVLGDRFEALGVAMAARVLGIPIAHLHGGEITEGAHDDVFRHAITKLSDYHFVATNSYRRRVLQLGEDPKRVEVVGAFGLDHVKRSTTMTFAQMVETLPFPLTQPYALATYHPVTQGDEPPGKTADAMLTALLDQTQLKILATYPNADAGGRDIINVLEAWQMRMPGRVVLVPNLGFERYLSAVENAAVVIGNSSSGLIEVPAFHIPTVNIGLRQKGRLSGPSVLNCGPSRAEISEAIEKALSTEFYDICLRAESPYGQGEAAAMTLRKLKCDMLIQKSMFHDLH